MTTNSRRICQTRKEKKTKTNLETNTSQPEYCFIYSTLNLRRSKSVPIYPSPPSSALSSTTSSYKKKIQRDSLSQVIYRTLLFLYFAVLTWEGGSSTKRSCGHRLRCSDRGRSSGQRRCPLPFPSTIYTSRTRVSTGVGWILRIHRRGTAKLISQL